MRRIDWSERAIADLEAALAYIAEDSPQNAMLVRDRIFRTVKLMESFSLGLPAPNGAFKLFIPKTSYFVIFRRSPGGDISLRAFLHAAQDWGKFDWDKLA
jgi:plasmid stabilization system protein ParE